MPTAKIKPYDPNEPEYKSFYEKHRFLIISLFILIFAIFVWPTPYKPLPDDSDLYGRHPKRLNRLTGKIEYKNLKSGEWK